MPYNSRNRRMLNEYTLVDSMRNEADDPQDNNQDGAGQQPPMGGNQNGGAPQGGQQGGAPDMGGGMPQPGGDPGMGGQQPPMGGDPGMDMGADPGMGQQPPMGGDPNGGMDMADGLDIPQDGMGDFGGPIDDVDMDGGMGVDQMQPDDEVIDVDELTNAQEEASARIDGVDEKLTTLGKVIEKFIDAIKQNDSKIADLKAEFEKRNPTQQEKFNIRSQASGPFTESPREYWDKVASTNPNYQVMYNNDVPTKDEQKEFELRKRDINDMDDRSVISSFDYPSNLEDILDF